MNQLNRALRLRRTRILLTHEQVRSLQPYIDRLRSAAALGSPGMLVAQISYDQEGRHWLTPAFLPRDVASVITEKGMQL